MLSNYIESKLKKTKFKVLKDKSYFAFIPSVPGVWANAGNKKAAKKELREVLEEWILLKVRDKENIPGLSIKFDRRSAFKHV